MAGGEAGRRSPGWRWALVLTSVVVAAVAALAGLIWTGVVHPNNPSREQYPVWGVDVSRYQGEIDWPVLAAQGIEFAFIKATEGSSYVDPRFAANLEGASAAGLRAGAYHFFSFESAGATQ
ncbi:MAG: lysozyme, partial [Propionibacteriaceae bacterium]|nr:lysozyme [Propionibacteriaceae bacterium]